MTTKQPEMKVVCVTLKGKGWTDFSGTLCGIEFEDGEGTLAMDMDPHGRDMIALRNVTSTYVGTSYEVLGDYVEDVPDDEDEDDVIEPPKEDGDGGAHGEGDEDATEASEKSDGAEGADEAESPPETDEGEGDEDAGAEAAKT